MNKRATVKSRPRTARGAGKARPPKKAVPARVGSTGRGSDAALSALRKREVRSLDGWRGQAIELALGQGDLDLLDNALCVMPGLRAVVRLAQEARRRGVRYPVTSARQLASLLGRDSLKLAGHRVNAKSIAHALADQWFPIAHEGELLTVIHLGLRRCEAEAAAAAMDGLKAQGTEVRQPRAGKRARR